MESTTFSSLRATKMGERELMCFMRPEEISDLDLIRIAFDAANRERNGEDLIIYHRRAINELMDRFSARQVDGLMWEAAESLRNLEDVQAYELGESAKETLSFLKEDLELESVTRLMTIVTTSDLHQDTRRTANALRFLREHFLRGHFQYDDEEHLSILLYRVLKDERDPKVLFEAACILESFGKKEALPYIRGAINGRTWGEYSEVKRKLVSVERNLSGGFREGSAMRANHAYSSRRNQAPASAEKTEIIVKRVNRA